jgi:hypothetical protein
LSVPETPEKKRHQADTAEPKSPVYYARSFAHMSNPMKRKIHLG